MANFDLSGLTPRAQAPADRTSVAKAPPKVTVDDICNFSGGSAKIAGFGQGCSAIGISRYTAGQGSNGGGLNAGRGAHSFLFGNSMRPIDAMGKAAQEALERRKAAQEEAAQKGQGQHLNGLG